MHYIDQKETCKISSSLVLYVCMASCVFSKEVDEDEGKEHGKSVKIMLTCISYLVIFSLIYCMLLLFLHVFHLHVLIELKLKVKQSPYVWQSLYTQYYHTV